MSGATIDQLMDLFPEFFIPEQAAGVNTSVFFNLEGEQGGMYFLKIANSTCSVEKINSPVPADLTLTATASDILDIFSGELDAMQAFMRGRLRMQGNMALAMKLTGYFKINREKIKSMRG